MNELWCEMMAAAEARAVWQRTANRYFVQEDSKRAPKLTTSSHSSSSSTKQVQEDPVSSPPPVVRPQNQPSSPGFMPLNIPLLLGHHIQEDLLLGWTVGWM
ncbi:uncharacterized protein LOC130511532 [Raphanus sativus]|uniref:Uncharacterized protein LOC108852556 n=1 Tax=Raphanus sativus TaxID=3726 RepID=A0A6J0NA19_RAPSA|nr:uncharacterized protein LOC108852556 [Raphanus sativus]XP_056851820.1 uncharacterized protein LOC130500922 [Raphanus sativus]XP_056851979.1 uncharacterized protein LOC130494312 [Raphanus sativus]XP_056853063.1 uncharacterized protein LOC130502312 [Raphanus sativus]XP_056855792.1 uncharacterized protein LOC130505210 [Raphanus sativus]XP_056864605.1 uncharacterized protein LOC130511532 [Raphanus sativus]